MPSGWSDLHCDTAPPASRGGAALRDLVDLPAGHDQRLSTCSHLIVGRDHAGVGSYYGPFDVHHIFDEIPEGALHTQALKLDLTFWCHKRNGMASGRTCPHDDSERLQVSGTQFRKSLSEGQHVPPEFSRPEVVEILRAYYAELDGKPAAKAPG